MDMLKYDIKDIEKLLIENESDLQELIEFQKRLEYMEHNMKVLNDYYAIQYMDDMNRDQSEDNIRYRALDEDSIWNVLADYHKAKIKLLKTIAETL